MEFWWNYTALSTEEPAQSLLPTAPLASSVEKLQMRLESRSLVWSNEQYSDETLYKDPDEFDRSPKPQTHKSSGDCKRDFSKESLVKTDTFDKSGVRLFTAELKLAFCHLHWLFTENWRWFYTTLASNFCLNKCWSSSSLIRLRVRLESSQDSQYRLRSL